MECICKAHLEEPWWWGGSLAAKSCPTFVTPWTVTRQAPLSMRFPRQGYWSGLPHPSPLKTLKCVFSISKDLSHQFKCFWSYNKWFNSHPWPHLWLAQRPCFQTAFWISSWPLGLFLVEYILLGRGRIWNHFIIKFIRSWIFTYFLISVKKLNISSLNSVFTCSLSSAT